MGQLVRRDPIRPLVRLGERDDLVSVGFRAFPAKELDFLPVGAERAPLTATRESRGHPVRAPKP
ncbi:MAG: hypothetical protein QOE90_1345 [Thermoplasmata archaeon]|jgi:hypothetical protein|nr:hypothetical protein [Thermoplasmata archaeon]